MQELIMKDLNRYTAVVDSDEFLSVRNFAACHLIMAIITVKQKKQRS
ncbi:hypothetical protein [Sodalis glossinidius]|nr:hypothetical protein [Sodalis glossinidius]